MSLEDIFKDLAGAKTTLAGAYGALLESEHYLKNMIVYPDLMAGNIKFSKSVNLSLEDVYLLDYTPLLSSFNASYTAMYSELNNVNNIIKYTPSAEGSAADKAKLIAEAKCIRALNHFDLLRTFARPYSYTVDGSHLGITINLVPRLFTDPSPLRSTCAQSFQAIINDLTEAIATFDDTNSGVLNGTYQQNFFTKSSAKALLAKVYLYSERWDEAYALADEVIRSNRYTLLNNAEYAGSWTGRVPSSESIFELAIETDFAGTGLGGYFDISDNTYRMYAATTDLLSLYGDNDVRGRAAMFNSLTLLNVNYYYTKKYAAGGTSQTPVKLLRLSEMYLIRAEAALEKGNPDFIQANADLNTIRKRGDATAQDLNITIKEDLITAVLLERRKELAFEGNFSFDLARRRLNIVRTDCVAQMCDIQANDFRLVMPLPAETINTNNNMIQNQGY